MSNDKAQELTAKITKIHHALCAETDAAKQSATYRAWLPTPSAVFTTTLSETAFSFGRKPRKLPESLDSILENRLAVL